MKNFSKLAKKIISLIFGLVAIISVTFFITSTLVLAAWQGPTDPPPEGNPGGFILDTASDSPPQAASINVVGPICLGDQNHFCINSWDDITGTGVWSINEITKNIFYLAGNVGIGKEPGSKIALDVLTSGGTGSIGILGSNISGSAASYGGVFSASDDGTALFVANTGSGYGLQVVGDVQIFDGTQGAGKILVSDSDGNASWQDPSGGEGDNLGNHIATGALKMNDQDINNLEKINFTDSFAPAANPTINKILLHPNGYGIGISSGYLDYISGPNASHRLYSGTKELMRIVGSTGNVGIGTNNPSAKLEIDLKNLATTEGLHISRDSANSYSYLNVEDESGSPVFKVHENGNIGIGTGNPSAKLEVAGQVKITGGSPGSGKVLTSDAGGLASWQEISGGEGDNLGDHTATEALKMNGQGVNNLEKIDFTNSFAPAANSTINKILLHSSGYGFGVSSGNLDYTSADNHRWYDGTTELMRIVGLTGNVGIGTSNPGAKLEVAGQVKITGGGPGSGKVLTSDASGLASWQEISGGDTLPPGSSGQTLRYDGSGWAATSNLSNDGNKVSIGAGGDSIDFRVSGGAPRMELIEDVSGITWGIDNNNGQLRFFTLGVLHLAVASNGNVGLGTNNPGYPLDIKDNDNTTIINLDNVGNGLWTGTRLARNGHERWFIGLNDSDKWLHFRQGGAADSMVIDNDGNVGVGVDDPSAKLEVAGDILAIGDICANNGDDCLSDSSGVSDGYIGKVKTHKAGGNLDMNGNNILNSSGDLLIGDNVDIIGGLDVSDLISAKRISVGGVGGATIPFQANQGNNFTQLAYYYNSSMVFGVRALVVGNNDWAGYFSGGEGVYIGDSQVPAPNLDHNAKLFVESKSGEWGIRVESDDLGISSTIVTGVKGSAVQGSIKNAGTRGFLGWKPFSSEGYYAAGVYGESNYTGAALTIGVFGSSNNGMGVMGKSSNGWAGYFTGGKGVHIESDSGAGTALEVAGIIRAIPQLSVDCSSDTEGGIYYDQGDKAFYGCNGTSWKRLDD